MGTGSKKAEWQRARSQDAQETQAALEQEGQTGRTPQLTTALMEGPAPCKVVTLVKKTPGCTSTSEDDFLTRQNGKIPGLSLRGPLAFLNYMGKMCTAELMF